MVELQLVWVVVTIIVTVVSAVLLVFSRRRQDIDRLDRQHREELAGLAETRKQIIDELRLELAAINEKHDKEISNLNAQVAELRGQYEALRNFQIRDIIDSVTEGVLNGLGAAEL